MQYDFQAQAIVSTPDQTGIGPDITARAAIFCDLDGCLVTGNRLLPGVKQLYQTVGERMWILSNNSTDTPDSLAQKIDCLGLNIPPTRIILAGAESVLTLATMRPKPSVALFASPALSAWAVDQGMLLTDTAPDTVLLCRDPAFDFASLARIIRLLEAGAELVVSNPDRAHPAADGGQVPETGALLASILAIRPAQKYRTIGKPSAHLFATALQRSGFKPEHVMMIGDNLDTDGSGATALNIPFAQVSPEDGVLSLLGSRSC